MMEFREVLQRERKSRGWNQEDLAAKIQVSRQAVSKWETGDAMPDLPKLLALADVLNISLDELCGRETPPPQPAVAAESPQATENRRRRWLWPVVCGILALCLMVGGVWAWSRKDYVPAEYAAAQSILPDSFTVTGVSFVGESPDRVAYQFTPSVTGEGLTYQITFTAANGMAITMDAPCVGGVCAGTAVVDSGEFGHIVTVSVSDGVNSRNVAIARGLAFNEGSASWTPLLDTP